MSNITVGTRILGAVAIYVGCATSFSMAIAQECKSTADQLEDLAIESLEQYAKMDKEGFLAARKDLRKKLPCVQDIISPAQAGLIHQVEMLHYFPQDIRNFAGHAQAAYVDGITGVTTGLVQDEHFMHQWGKVAVSRQLSDKKELESAFLADIYIDGVLGSSVSTDLPYIFQVYGNNGQVLQTTLVTTGGSVPEYATYPVVNSRSIVLHPRLTWIGLGLGGAALASGLVAYRAEQTFWDTSTDPALLEKYQHRTNQWTSVSIVMGVASVATLVTGGFLETMESKDTE